MNDYWTYLDDLDLPHIRVHISGRVVNEATGRELHPDKCGNIEFRTATTGLRCSISHHKLMGYCFRAPWAMVARPRTRNLGFLGFRRYFAMEDGTIFALFRMEFLNQDISNDGYPECVLTRDSDNKLCYFKTHRLIALAFVPNPENKNTVNHIDGNKLNNHYSNLEWMWNWENMDHALKTGLKHSVMTDEMVHRACQLLAAGAGVTFTARSLGVDVHNINDILDGCHYRIARAYGLRYPRSAKHIPKEFLHEVKYKN